MAQLPPLTAGKARPRVDPRPQDYDKALQARGLPVVWEQSAVCPCGRSADAFGEGFGFTDPTALRPTGESRTDCDVCKGKGYLYHSPTSTRVLVTGRSIDPKRYAELGETAAGVVGMTFRSVNLPAFMDRVTLSLSIMLYRELTKRALTGTVDTLRYPVVERIMPLATGTIVKGVLYAHKAAADGIATSAGVMVEGVDFTVTEAGAIDWTLGVATGKAPAPGARYAMTYFAHPRYVVTSHPFSARDTMILHKSPTEVHTELPIRAMAKLEYLGGVING